MTDHATLLINIDHPNIMITDNYFPYRRIDYDKVNLTIIEKDWLYNAVYFNEVFANVISNMKDAWTDVS